MELKGPSMETRMSRKSELKAKSKEKTNAQVRHEQTCPSIEMKAGALCVGSSDTKSNEIVTSVIR